MAKSIQLLSGATMPLIGYGTGGTVRITDYNQMFDYLDVALESGYRMIDTAQIYKTEAVIGDALIKLLPKHGLQRKDVFLTSKLHVGCMSVDKVRPSVEQTLANLKTDYLDLFLIHYPAAGWNDSARQDPNNKVARRESWLELEKLHAEGLLRSIGVSNYELSHLDEMSNYATITPSVNQVEFHPHFCRREFFNELRRRGIHPQAFSPLGRQASGLVEEPLLIELSKKYEISISQLLLAWPLAQNISVLPKSNNPQRIRENFGSVNAKLSDEDVEKIWSLNKNEGYVSFCKPWEVL